MDTAPMTESLKDELESIVGSGNALFDEPLSQHTTFEVGGPARYFVMPHDEREIQAVFSLCKASSLPLRVLGRGSNILAADEGVEGVVLLLAENYASICVDAVSGVIRAQAGASNADVAEAAYEAGLTGYEFASGIPGGIGGAAFMNAGAYDGEFKDVAVSVRCLNPEGEFVEIPAEAADWSYRHSMMADAGYIILEATLQLSRGDRTAIRARMDELKERRESKQPLEMPSAGSTFKRPEGHFAGKLIQDAGMQGVRVGGAQVSEKHAGFVVNAGGATAADVRALIALVQQRVKECSGVELEPEVRIWE